MLKKNILSILVALLILYLSLATSDTFKNTRVSKIPHIDKIVHFSMYFGLMSVILFENRKTLKSTRHFALISLIPLFYGILMEIMQSTLTATRSGSFFDVIFNLTGILASLFLWIWFKHSNSESIK